MPSATTGGITLEYESLGDSSGALVLLIMGLGMQLTAWPDPFCERLSREGYRVIRFDNRDAGLSTRLHRLGTPNLWGAFLRKVARLPIRAPYTLHDLAADTIGLLDQLNIARAHVVGVSMGGMIAQLLAAHYRERVLSLTSIMSSSGAHHLPKATWKATRAMLSRPANPRDAASVVEHLQQVFGVIGSPGFPIDPNELRARIERSVRRSYYPPGTARQLVAIEATGDRSPLLATITAPTLVIHGKEDPLVPVEAGIDTASKIPGATLDIIPGMGHDMAAWPILADKILAFIASTGERRSIGSSGQAGSQG